MATSPMQFPRAVRAAPEPLGWYLRPSYVDHRAIGDVVASGSVGVYGVVFDPVYQARQSELHDLMAERGFDAILDPRTQELGSAGASTGVWRRCRGRWTVRIGRTISETWVPGASLIG